MDHIREEEKEEEEKEEEEEEGAGRKDVKVQMKDVREEEKSWN